MCVCVCVCVCACVRACVCVTPIATAVVLLHGFYCIFVYHVLIILDLYFASWAAVRA